MLNKYYKSLNHNTQNTANMSAMHSHQNPFFRLEEEIYGEDQR